MSTIKVRRNPNFCIEKWSKTRLTKAQRPRETLRSRSKTQIPEKFVKTIKRHFVTEMATYVKFSSDSELYKKVLLEDETFQKLDFGSQIGSATPVSESRRLVLKYIYHFGRENKQS